MFFKEETAFTLVELIIVVIIIAVLAGIAIPGFLGAQKHAIDSDAQTQLKLIQTAEKVYEMEQQQYIGCGSNSDCNDKLGLELPPNTANGGKWNYSVSSDGQSFTAVACGSEGTDEWRIDQDLTEASSHSCN
jgi:prepilin-type N-terminal cleavage/methylation domain-containing protein